MKSLLVIAVMLFGFTNSYAGDCTWIGDSSSVWSDTNNWSSYDVPGKKDWDNVFIDKNTNGYDPLFPSSYVYFGTLTVTDSNTLTTTGTLYPNYVTIAETGEIIVGDGGVLSIRQTDVLDSGTVTLLSGGYFDNSTSRTLTFASATTDTFNLNMWGGTMYILYPYIGSGVLNIDFKPGSKLTFGAAKGPAVIKAIFAAGTVTNSAYSYLEVSEDSTSIECVGYVDLTDGTDNLNTVLGAIEGPTTIVLKRGATYSCSQSIAQSVTIMSEEGEGDPAILNLGGLDVVEGSAIDYLTLSDVEATGTFTKYVMNMSKSGSIDEFTIEDSYIHNVRGIFRAKTSGITIGSFTIDNCIIDSIGSYGVMIMDNDDASCTDVVYSNSTFMNCYQLARWKDAVNDDGINSVAIENCDFHNVPDTSATLGGGGGYLFRIDADTVNVEITNSIFGYSTDRISSGIVNLTITDSYKTSDCELSGLEATAYAGSSADLWVNPATDGDFTFKDELFAGAAIAGDPRWIDFPSDYSILYITDSDRGDENPVIDWLTAQGFNVDVLDWLGTNWTSLADGSDTLALINSYDIAILGRSPGSGDITDGKAYWNDSITIPLVDLSAYHLRSNKLGWINSTSASTITGDLTYAVVDTADHNLLRNISVDGDSIAWSYPPDAEVVVSDLSTSTLDAQAIAAVDGYISLALWDTIGKAFYVGATDTVRAVRVGMPLGYDGSDIAWNNYLCLTPDGQQLFLNVLCQILDLPLRDVEAFTNDATLSSLTVSDGELSPAFDATVLEYTVKSTEASITIEAVANDGASTVSGTGSVENGTTATIQVVAQTGKIISYTVEVTGPQPSEFDVLYITDASRGDEGPFIDWLAAQGFNVDVMDWTDTDWTTVTGASDTLAKINSYGLAILGRSPGSTTITNGKAYWNDSVMIPLVDLSAYHLRSNKLGWINSTSAASITDDEIYAKVDPSDELLSNVTVIAEDSTIAWTYGPDAEVVVSEIDDSIVDGKVVAAVDGYISLALWETVGKAFYKGGTDTVRAPRIGMPLGYDGDDIAWENYLCLTPDGQQLFLNVICDVLGAVKNEAVVFSNDASLSSLTVSDGTLDPSFDATVLSYSVETELATIDVSATATDENAVVSGTGTADSGTVAKVVVVAQTGKKVTYSVDIIGTGTNENGVNDALLSDVNVYPIPATDKLYVENVMNAEVSVYQMNGTLVSSMVATSNNQEIDIANLANGMYIMNIRTEDNSYNLQFVKE